MISVQARAHRRCRAAWGARAARGARGARAAHWRRPAAGRCPRPAAAWRRGTWCTAGDATQTLVRGPRECDHGDDVVRVRYLAGEREVFVCAHFAAPLAVLCGWSRARCHLPAKFDPDVRLCQSCGMTEAVTSAIAFRRRTGDVRVGFLAQLKRIAACRCRSVSPFTQW